MKWPLKPTEFDSNPYNWDWYEKDFFHSPDGTEEFPDHHCKQTWMVSLPFIMSKRNAIDVGCRDGEYTRYIHKDFQHVYCFDYRQRKRFHMNVDLKKITHFKCALGDEHKIIKVSGAGSITAKKIPLDRWYNEQLYTIDEFSFENIDYIKIDVDGYELPVLKGAVKTIEKYKPILVLEQEFGETAALDFCIEKFQYRIAAWDPLHRNVVLVAH